LRHLFTFCLRCFAILGRRRVFHNRTHLVSCARVSRWPNPCCGFAKG
jgi:hypothetical protein